MQLATKPIDRDVPAMSGQAVPAWWKLLAAALLLGLMVHWLWPILSLPDGYWMGRRTLSFDLYRSLGVIEAWKQGFWDARFLPTFNFGYGYLIFSFYGPLYAWVSAGWIAILGDWQLGMVCGVATFLLAGTAGVFAASQRLYRCLGTSSRAALIAGVLSSCAWLVSPYLKVNLFARSDGPEFAGMSLLPWVVYGALRVLAPGPDDQRIANMAPLAIALALAVLSHNVCAMFAMGLVVLLPPTLLLVTAAESGRAGAVVRCLPRYALAVAWGLGLAAFFWIPAIIEMRSTRAFGIFHEHGLTFMGMPVFLGLDFFTVPTGGQFPRHLGWILVPAVLSGLVAITASAAAVRRMCLTLLVALGGLTWMLLSQSEWFWYAVPMMRVVQFAFRVLTISTLLVCLLLPAAFVMGGTNRRWVTVVLSVVLAAAVGRSLWHYTIVFPRPMPSPETLWGGKVLTAVLNEYATIWQSQAAVQTVPAGTVTPGEGVRITATRGQYRHLRISMKCDGPGKGEVEVAYTYFPGWYAYLEEGNVPVDLGPAKSGMIRLSGIPAGSHVVRLNFGNTPNRTACRGVSLVAAAALVAAGLRRRRERHEMKQTSGAG